MVKHVDVKYLGDGRYECSMFGRTTRVVTATSDSHAVELYLLPADRLQSPQRGRIYSFREICKALELKDSPSLLFDHGGRTGVIQHGHVTDEQLLSVPGFADTGWIYLYTTHEWIPCFRYSYENKCPISDYVDLEPLIDKYKPELEKTHWWVTPKGFPRSQHE